VVPRTQRGHTEEFSLGRDSPAQPEMSNVQKPMTKECSRAKAEGKQSTFWSWANLSSEGLERELWDRC
jgi:hypothetical protein